MRRGNDERLAGVRGAAPPVRHTFLANASPLITDRDEWTPVPPGTRAEPDSGP
jgi:hypothetical protein